MLTGPQLLGRLARLGPHFAVETYPSSPDSLPAGRSGEPWRPVELWRPFGELVDSSGALADRVAEVRAALAVLSGVGSAGEVDQRVAVSMAQLALTARLVCPALGTAVLTGGLLPLDPARMRWQPAPDGAVTLAVPDDAVAAAAAGNPEAAAAAELAAALAGSVLAGPVRALVEASSRFAVSPRVLWGNVASVVNGTRTLIGTAVPELRNRAHAIVAEVLEQPPLAGTHYASSSGSSSGTRFRRRSCCLVYRLAAGQAASTPGFGRPVCGDCVLNQECAVT